MIVLNMYTMDFQQITLQKSLQPFTQGSCCSVTDLKPAKRTKGKRYEPIDEGIYYFGGKNQKGEVQGKLKFASFRMHRDKIVNCEFFRI